ncbi:MAG: 30S ribosomal protein S8 [Thermoplasmata archaeon]|uniref:Small ribosomal subunit protein uS8 n=1 Tax=Candidatus Sysuiplasma superficiale TaxID=2823368 RepID=A0A8J8CDS8_9ARCH|nr:30S ribosomal protein S8 [Candidatus Sysuiplasma superficiale]MBX8644680.1 30S ribosomal protein S8 [Candidatus Sysuiplasma superficiale]
MKSDPLNDAMSTIKNAEERGKDECTIRPASRLIGHVLKVMAENGYIRQFELVDDGKGGLFRVVLAKRINNCGVVKPRHSVGRREIELFESRYLPAQDFGLLIMTTTNGVMSQFRAKELGVGGKLLAYVY